MDPPGLFPPSFQSWGEEVRGQGGVCGQYPQPQSWVSILGSHACYLYPFFVCFILLGCFDLGKTPCGGQRPGVLEWFHTSGGIWISLCLCLAGLVHWCTVLGLCKSLVYYGRLLLHRLGIPGGQARMSATGCVPGSLAAGLSTAQGT